MSTKSSNFSKTQIMPPRRMKCSEINLQTFQDGHDGNLIYPMIWSAVFSEFSDFTIFPRSRTHFIGNRKTIVQLYILYFNLLVVIGRFAQYRAGWRNCTVIITALVMWSFRVNPCGQDLHRDKCAPLIWCPPQFASRRKGFTSFNREFCAWNASVIPAWLTKSIISYFLQELNFSWHTDK